MSADHCDRYSITRAGQLIDDEPMAEDKPPLVFDKSSGRWVVFNGVMGEWTDSIPVTAKEARQFCKDGTIPGRVSKAIADDTGYYPEPWDD
jgi:hypothetical protein